MIDPRRPGRVAPPCLWLALAAAALAAPSADLEPVCGPDEVPRQLGEHRTSVRLLELVPRPGPRLEVAYRVEHEGPREDVRLRLSLCLAVDGLPSGVLEVEPVLGATARLSMTYGRLPPEAPPPPGSYRVTARLWLEDPPGSGRRARDASPEDDLDTAALVYPGGSLRTLSSTRPAPAPTPAAPPGIGAGEGEPASTPGTPVVTASGGAAHAYSVVTVDAVPDGDFHVQLYAVVANLGAASGPTVPARFLLDDTEGFTVRLEPEAWTLPSLAPGEEATLELEARELLVGLSGRFEVDAGDDDPEDDSFPWLVEFPEFGY